MVKKSYIKKLIFCLTAINLTIVPFNLFSQKRIGDTIVFEIEYKPGKIKTASYFVPSIFDNHKLIMVKIVRYYKNGKKESQKNSPNGELDGAEYRWYPNGQLQSWELFKNEKWWGHKLWYENGKIQQEMFYDTITNEEKHFSYDKKGRCTNYYTTKNYLHTGGRTFSSSDKFGSSWGYFIDGVGVDSLFYPNGKLNMVQYYNGFEKPDSIKYFGKDEILTGIDRLVQEKSFTFTREKYDHGKKIAIYYFEKNFRVKTEQLINGVWETEQYFYDEDGFMYRKTTGKGDEFFENKKKKKSK